MIVITLISLLLAGFVIWRGVWPLPLRRCWKCFLAAADLLIACKFHLIRWFGGDFFAPALGRPFLLAFAWLYACWLIFSLLLLIGELFLLAGKGIRRFFPKLPSIPVNAFHAILLATALFLTTWGIVEGTRMPQVVKRTILLPPGYQGKRPLRIVLLADLHADEVTKADRIADIVRKSNELSPDLVLIAGDFADGRSAAEKELLPLRALRAEYGVFGVPGNHEYFSAYHGSWLASFSSLGIRMLVNDSALLPCGIALAGISDESASWKNEEMPDFDKAWKKIPAGMPVIQLAHRPHWAVEAARRGAFLQVSGHTHGGMFFPLTLLVARSNGGFVSGRYEVSGMTLIVSNGSGIWSGFPLRIGRPPEILLLELK